MLKVNNKDDRPPLALSSWPKNTKSFEENFNLQIFTLHSKT